MADLNMVIRSYCETFDSPESPDPILSAELSAVVVVNQYAKWDGGGVWQATTEFVFSSQVCFGTTRLCV